MEYLPWTQNRNADGLSKRTNDYRWQGQLLEKLPPVAERWNFLSQDEYEGLPIAPWFDVLGRILSNHPDLPSHPRKVQPTLPNTVQTHTADQTTGKQREAWQASLPLSPPPMLHAHGDFYPDYPEDWIDVTEEASHYHLLPTHMTNVASPTTYPLAEASGAMLQTAPNNVKQSRFAIRSLSTDLNEH